MLNFSNPVIIIILAVTGMPLYWLILCLLIAKITGWAKLAEVFPDTSYPIASEVLRFQSIRLKSGNYGGCLTFGALPQGLRFQILWLFRFGHNPLIIPWSELNGEMKTGHFGETYIFTIQSMPKIFFSTNKKLGSWIVEKKKQYCSS